MYIVQPPIRTGDHPGAGVWRCMKCNWRVTIEDRKTPLPPCGGDCKDDPAIDETQAEYGRIRPAIV